jgi:hypothetical protein
MGSTRSRSILFVLCGLAVVGAASADFNVRLESGHGGIVRRLEPLNINAKMSFVHISKCAGASWVHEMKLIFEHFYPQHEAGPEVCEYFNSRDWVVPNVSTFKKHLELIMVYF